MTDAEQPRPTPGPPPLESDRPDPAAALQSLGIDDPLRTHHPPATGQSFGAEAPGPSLGRSEGRRDADFSRAVLEDLYRYPRKKRWVARLLWLFGGFGGVHRFYLDRTGTGLLMMFTGGGAGAWWIVDGFLIKRMVNGFNEDQAARQQDGRPPRSLSFMPPTRGALLPPFPEWAAKRSGRGRIVFDAILLFMFGSILGTQTVQSGNPEPVIAVFALIAITLLGAKWDALAHIPILNGFDRWNHRLRLFYYVTDPGGPLRLAFRPLYGLVISPFRKRARAEARMYLQLGVVFTLVFTALDVVQSLTATGSGFGVATVFAGVGLFTADMLQTLTIVYLFAAPIGAILTTHLLLERTDRLIWVLSGITLVSMVLGLLGGGFAPDIF